MIELMEKTANMLRGICMDPRIPRDTKDAMTARVRELDASTEAALANKAEETDLVVRLRAQIAAVQKAYTEAVSEANAPSTNGFHSPEWDDGYKTGVQTCATVVWAALGSNTELTGARSASE